MDPETRAYLETMEERLKLRTEAVETRLLGALQRWARIMSDDQRSEFLRQSIESHDRQIGELTEGLASLRVTVATQTANIDRLVQVTNQDATAIRTLARIAEAHEARLRSLEPGGAQ